MRLRATNSDDLLLIKVADFLSAQWTHFPSDVPLVSTMLVMALKRFPFLEHECFVDTKGHIFPSPSKRHLFIALKYLFQIYLNDMANLFASHPGDCVRAFSIGPGFDILEAVVFFSLASRYNKTFKLAYCEKSDKARFFLSQQIIGFFPNLGSFFHIFNSPLSQDNFFELGVEAFGEHPVDAILAQHIETRPHQAISMGTTVDSSSKEMSLPQLCIKLALMSNVHTLLIRTYSDEEYDETIAIMAAELINNAIKPTRPTIQQRPHLYTPYSTKLCSDVLFQSFCKIVRGMDRHQILVNIEPNHQHAKFT
ncbi:MAG: hypothetical protein CL816_04845 [Coxiellaceae bacterium]|nr:hypothetical protein [Coxiellaceae bacterium]